MATRTAHLHRYEQHPNPKWASHAACSVCGFALPKWALAKSTGRFKEIRPDQVSDGLKSELGIVDESAQQEGGR